MIPRIQQTSSIQSLYLQFLESLKEADFEGDISPDYASRTVLSTDNSIYQVLPQGIVYPKNINDLTRLTELAARLHYHSIVLSPRGGGTGTNGQSLTDGLVVDMSRHMNNILEINAEQGWARVQAGVVKDQLNAAIKPYGLFFAPELSTSNRATIGGMINTDASGQGSCRYGKTRDHVLELTTVLMDGNVLRSHAISDEQLATNGEEQNICGLAHRLVNNIQQEHQALIKEKFPPLNRCLTGYDLAHIRDANGQFNLNNILCGSEGTLGFIAEAKINLLTIPQYSALVIVNYDSFDSSLRDATHLMKAGPTSIETIDSRVLALAMGDSVWHDVAAYFPSENIDKIKGMNLVEYTADTKEELSNGIAQLITVLKSDEAGKGAVGHGLAMGDEAVKKIWNMRKKAVGLLGNAKGEGRPIPFVEDTAVPPENLADYIAEFRAILDSYNLTYGMFGHVDAGVLHVRPAIDMKDSTALKMVRDITDQVSALTQKYNGLLWGEHGKGVRSEYAPAFFGELFVQLQRIKGAFDPRNQLNPGKIATPVDSGQLLKIDEVPTRGQNDQTIPVKLWDGFSEAVYCNGNGACFNWNTADAMCPSYKVTRNRVHSPKGRASLIREWIKQLGEHGFNPENFEGNYDKLPAADSFMQRRRNSKDSNLHTKNATPSGGVKQYDFSHEVMDSMSQCLACKSCVGQCPIKVDVPEFRSKFLALYHTRYARPLKDYFVANLERFVPKMAHIAGIANFMQSLPPVKYFLQRAVGFVDSPKLSRIPFNQCLKELGIQYATTANIQSIRDEQKSQSVILVQDAFTRFFEAQVVLDSISILQKLGFNVLLAPYRPNGKPMHVHGFLKEFKKQATVTAEHLNTLAQSGIPLIGLDPAMTLAYRSEYVKALGEKDAPKVQLVQEWLATHLESLTDKKALFNEGTFKLLGHCTEKTNAPASTSLWQSVFSKLGQTLNIEAVGCCGMAGTFGHETQNREASAKIFDLSWRQPVTAAENKDALVATGYSCRSQSLREAGVHIAHPLQALLANFIGESSGKPTHHAKTIAPHTAATYVKPTDGSVAPAQTVESTIVEPTIVEPAIVKPIIIEPIIEARAAESLAPQEKLEPVQLIESTAPAESVEIIIPASNNPATQADANDTVDPITKALEDEIKALLNNSQEETHTTK
ncbi:D-2-hydroxyglutarate dehydrogenase YdiJ [Marinagarivorans algicola]|uniref:D-2-hydroxyglutarate dehydrogenase YdiJ n=1 Tax=Marinagarivorans algicola TaxID=1513270 RepID=UPI003734CF95